MPKTEKSCLAKLARLALQQNPTQVHCVKVVSKVVLVWMETVMTALQDGIDQAKRRIEQNVFNVILEKLLQESKVQRPVKNVVLDIITTNLSPNARTALLVCFKM
jgi:hypothetical protein